MICLKESFLIKKRFKIENVNLSNLRLKQTIELTETDDHRRYR